jgi:hypothetical protein
VKTIPTLRMLALCVATLSPATLIGQNRSGGGARGPKAQAQQNPAAVILEQREALSLTCEQITSSERVRAALDEKNSPTMAKLEELRANRAGDPQNAMQTMRPLMEEIRSNSEASRAKPCKSSRRSSDATLPRFSSMKEESERRANGLDRGADQAAIRSSAVLLSAGRRRQAGRSAGKEAAEIRPQLQKRMIELDAETEQLLDRFHKDARLDALLQRER